MYRIFLHTKISDVHLNNVTHDIVEHEKACGFLDVSLADEIEDRGDNLVHALYILNFRIQSREDKKYSRHVIIPEGYLLLLMAHNTELVGSRY
jgi:hypothetical protein